MTERCPLDLGPEMTFEIPDVCMRQCQELYVNASESSYDRYDTDEHCRADTEFSHDALHRTGDSGERSYVVVDRCTQHDEEVGEQGYNFVCPHSQTDN